MKRSYFPIELFLECISWKSYSFLYVKFMITNFRQFVNMAYRSIITANLLYSLWTLEEQKHHRTCPKSSRYSLLHRKRKKERAPEENSLSFLLLVVKMCLHMHRFFFPSPFEVEERYFPFVGPVLLPIIWLIFPSASCVPNFFSKELLQHCDFWTIKYFLLFFFLNKSFFTTLTKKIIFISISVKYKNKQNWSKYALKI